MHGLFDGTGSVAQLDAGLRPVHGWVVTQGAERRRGQHVGAEELADGLAEGRHEPRQAQGHGEQRPMAVAALGGEVDEVRRRRPMTGDEVVLARPAPLAGRHEGRDHVAHVDPVEGARHDDPEVTLSRLAEEAVHAGEVRIDGTDDAGRVHDDGVEAPVDEPAELNLAGSPRAVVDRPVGVQRPRAGLIEVIVSRTPVFTPLTLPTASATPSAAASSGQPSRTSAIRRGVTPRLTSDRRSAVLRVVHADHRRERVHVGPWAAPVREALREFLSTMEDDLEIWRHQKYVANPALAAQDAKPCKALRKWVEQFYDVPADE